MTQRVGQATVQGWQPVADSASAVVTPLLAATQATGQSILQTAMDAVHPAVDATTQVAQTALDKAAEAVQPLVQGTQVVIDNLSQMVDPAAVGGALVGGSAREVVGGAIGSVVAGPIGQTIGQKPGKITGKQIHWSDLSTQQMPALQRSARNNQ
jgi:hypothetical protein